MNSIAFFLRLQVKQKEDDIFISQDKYVAEILKKNGFIKVKTVSTPIETQKPLLKDEDGEEVDVHMYRSMIGSLMYFTSSRPDIMFAVCACARYQVNLKVSHLNAVKRIFRYLKGQPKLGLWYPKDSPFDLVAYTDSDYARASLDRKSTTGACQFLRCRLILRQCKKQTVVANSITEAEYMAALNGKDIVITEASVRSYLQLADKEGGGPKCQETMGDTTAQTRFESVSKHSNDSLLARDKDHSKNETDSLKRRVKKLKKRNRSRTHKMKRLYKVGLTTRVESSGDEESLGEDASKQRIRIDDINADEDITLVIDTDNEMFDVDDLGGKEVFVAGQNENVVEEVVNVAQVSTAATIVIITTEEITLAQALEALKTSKPKAKGIVFKSQVEDEKEKAELVEGKQKRVGTEPEQEITKKQKVEEDKEKAELK
uniref:Uncharacterized mitochondrial protein AtMg00810-like n=1 Tax=Tanacetum cinerariifolium TaxID=118510 RepID=A0A6L2L8M2_TANCI|nr:uncharacterized mitochondrial protein AtMg00810-like [Tanacetum cinerariifolium]